ncbi:MAG TPA: hypothetical protein VHH09_04500 [Acidimicrobiales bacterium]|nr:hypothetical protein [Acidimicrobiales bacterium]
MPSRRLVLACALAVAVVLVADGAVVAMRARRSPEPQEPTAFDAVVADLRAFVERERGLTFLRPVPVELQSDEEFGATLRRLERRRGGDADAAVLVNVLRALGLVDGPFDASVLESGADEEVLGFYDPGRRRLYVRGDEATPAVRRVVVHELVHALADQHFGLERPALDRREDEAARAFAALVEGDAVRVEERFYESLSAEERRAADVAADAVGSIDPDLPRVFEVLLAFPYDAGSAFVAALAAAGGPERINAAFANPPSTSEQILHPERFLADEPGKDVTSPVPDGRVVDRGVLGELGLRLLLQEGVDRGAAARGADGWGADRYVAWTNGDQTCVRAHVVMDSPADRDELLDGLRQWAARNPGANVDGADPVTLTRCA